MTPSADNDEALAMGFAAHERWAFGEAYRRYASPLYSAAYNVLENADDASDCVADAFARLWRAPNAYRADRGNLRSFLVVCVRNEALSRRRRQGRRSRAEARIAGLTPVEAEAPQFADPIERDRVRRALRDLSDDQRVAIELAFYDGKTHTEIAAELQQPLGTIKSRIKLGLRKLASALESSRPQGAESQ